MYFDLLCHEWIGGPLADDLNEIARLLGEDRRTIAPVWASIRARFVVDSDAKLRHLKLESMRNRARIKSEKSSNNAKKRWMANADAYPTQQCDGNAIQSQSHSQSHKEPDQSIPSGVPDGTTGIEQGEFRLLAPKPAVRRKTDKPPNEAYQLVEFFEAGWVKAFSPEDGKPPPRDDAMFAQAKKLIADHTMPVATKYVLQFLADRDPWIHARGHQFRDVTSRVAAYKKSALSPQPVARGSPLPMSTSVSDETRKARKF